MKNNNWYPWVVVGLLWVVALLQLYGSSNALHHARSNENRHF